jgi:hypothetical protein
MKTFYTDMDLGSQHGRLGFEAKYPNNANYMDGFNQGSRFFAAWCKRNEPFGSVLPSGTNDQNESV